MLRDLRFFFGRCAQIRTQISATKVHGPLEVFSRPYSRRSGGSRKRKLRRNASTGYSGRFVIKCVEDREEEGFGKPNPVSSAMKATKKGRSTLSAPPAIFVSTPRLSCTFDFERFSQGVDAPFLNEGQRTVGESIRRLSASIDLPNFFQSPCCIAY